MGNQRNSGGDFQNQNQNNNRFQNQRQGNNNNIPNNMSGRGGRGGGGGRGNRRRGGEGRFSNDRGQNWEQDPQGMNNNHQQWIDDGGRGEPRGGHMNMNMNNQRGGGGRGGGNNNGPNQRFNNNQQPEFYNQQQDQFYNDDYDENPPFQYAQWDQAQAPHPHPQQQNDYPRQNMDYDGQGPNHSMRGNQNQNDRMMNHQTNNDWNNQQQCQEEPPGSHQTAEPAPTRAQQQQWDREDDEDERLFDEQFKKWEDQFNAWKLQNVDHPDRSSYMKYEREFEDVRIRLMERRDQMRQRRLSARQEILKNQSHADRGGPSNHPPQQQQQQQPQPQMQNRSQPAPTVQLPPPPPPPLEENERPQTKHDPVPPEAAGGSGDDLFKRSGSGRGIPGLDLVEPLKEKEYMDGEEVIDLEDEDAAKSKANKPEPEEEDHRHELEATTKESQPKFEVDADNINNILQNPNIMNLLNRVKSGTVEEPPPVLVNTPVPPPTPNVGELLQRVQTHIGHQNPVTNLNVAPPVNVNVPPGPNINALLQNPNISNLLEQVQSGLMGGPRTNPPPPINNNQIPIWNHPNPVNFGGNDIDLRSSELPPAFRGNPDALRQGMDGYGGPPRSAQFERNFQSNNFGIPPPQPNAFSGPPPRINMAREYNVLPPPVNSGGHRPNVGAWDPEFGNRRPAREILVPTKVVDYQHKSAATKDDKMDFFHRKNQTDSAPRIPVKNTAPAFTTPAGKGRNVFNSRWEQGSSGGGPTKRRSRFSDDVEPVDRKRSRDVQVEQKKMPQSQCKGDTKSTKNEEGPKSKPEDYLEGISDDEIDNNDPVDMGEDNLSLSSIEEVEDVPMAKGGGSNSKVDVNDQEDHNLISIEKILLNPGRKRRPRR